jgi:hypothetical protein
MLVDRHAVELPSSNGRVIGGLEEVDLATNF